ncbi:MAG: hypothetical protein KAI64_02785 [Thermoplasmata archaeon]|nr:hypothetical protein [Thermoplasmata archaeon]
MVMKGQWKTVESIIAGMIILMFVAAMGAINIQVSPHAPVEGYRALGALHEKEGLRAYAAAQDCSAIESLVSGTGYVVGYDFSVQVCNASGGCCGQVPDKENVWVSSLLLSGDEDYKPVEVILYLSRD